MTTEEKEAKDYGDYCNEIVDSDEDGNYITREEYDNNMMDGILD